MDPDFWTTSCCITHFDRKRKKQFSIANIPVTDRIDIHKYILEAKTRQVMAGNITFRY
jgi:hypothetical protein